MQSDAKMVISSKDAMKRESDGHFAKVLNQELKLLFGKEEAAEEKIRCKEPSFTEIKTAIKWLKNCKAPGIDSVIAEMLKMDIEFTNRVVKRLLNKIWRSETLLQDWKKGAIRKLPKKGNLNEFRNENDNIVGGKQDPRKKSSLTGSKQSWNEGWEGDNQGTALEEV